MTTWYIEPEDWPTYGDDEGPAPSRWCPVCETYGGHVQGCQETPEPDDEEGDEDA